jgi:anti-anti-sigma factor
MTWLWPEGPRAERVTIKVDACPGVTTVFISGELDLVTMPLLAEQVTRALQSRPRRLVFDLSGTAFMDCGSARLIAEAGRSLARRPVLRHPGPGVRRVLELTGLDALCEIES